MTRDCLCVWTATVKAELVKQSQRRAAFCQNSAGAKDMGVALNHMSDWMFRFCSTTERHLLYRPCTAWHTLWRDSHNLWNLPILIKSDKCEITGIAIQTQASLLDTSGVLRLYFATLTLPSFLFPGSHQYAFLHYVYMTACMQSEHHEKTYQAVVSASVTKLEDNSVFYRGLFRTICWLIHMWSPSISESK